MRIGQLRQRVTLEAEIQTADGGGGYTVEWSPVATCWARIAPLSGRERLVAQQNESTITHRVTMRARDDLDAGMRVVWGDLTLSIQAVIPDEKGTALILDCTQGGGT